ncbi:glycosyltransferase family 4 protein [Pseudazoarcus pumilus]|uniref:glycosyltransferase family 4 protein n=1 Tax=Pseudazoarcus pumilus TaxID=2067960 RepID=UPI0013DB1210|nr:glycosyltransferase family 4 protein [Pseudazoarcus pumilus]
MDEPGYSAMHLRVLLVHYWVNGVRGGAELSLLRHVECAPTGIEVVVAHAEDTPDLAGFDVVVVASVRPPGDYRDWKNQTRLVVRWTEALAGYEGFAIRSERDLHPCGQRDAACVGAHAWVRTPCECPPELGGLYRAFFDAFDVVHFLSPGHREIVRALVSVERPTVLIAPPIDLSRFRVLVPPEQRPAIALIFDCPARMAPTSAERARRAGYVPEVLPYLSVPYEDMPELLNGYAAVVVDPLMYHAFGRLAVEAQACGCRVLASERVGATSWPDALAAARVSSPNFWSLVGAAKLPAGERRQLLESMENG